MGHEKPAGDEGGVREALSTHPFNFQAWVQLDWPFLLPAGFLLLVTIGFLFLPDRPGEEWEHFLVFGLLAFAVAFAGCILCRIACSPTDVRVYPERLRWRRLGKEFDYPWDGLRAVYRSEVLFDRAQRIANLKLVFEDGQRVRFENSLADYDRLAALVQQITADRLLADARKHLDGPGAAFGPVQVRRDGLTIAGDSFPWDKVTEVAVFNGQIGCRSGEHMPCVRLATIPNSHVLLLLLAELGKRPVPYRT